MQVCIFQIFQKKRKKKFQRMKILKKKIPISPQHNTGQSLAGLNWMWQTTPAHILAGFVSDFSSSKVGHRQNVLCPNLDDVSFGHVCYKESQTTRHFCGGCQHAYGTFLIAFHSFYCLCRVFFSRV